MTLTYVSFALAVEKWIVIMITQDGNETNKEVIQYRNLFFTSSTYFSEVSLSRKMHDEAITDSKSPSVIKPITKLWNVICLRVVSSVKIWRQFSACPSLRQLKPDEKHRDGRLGFRIIYNHYLDLSNIDHMEAGVEKKLAQYIYTGEKRNFTSNSTTSWRA